MTPTPSTLPQWLSHIERQHPQGIALGLERVREVAVRLGLERPAARVISVAGTNGKGSTVAFIEAIARAAGWRVGAYTSPHLLRYNERVRIDGADAGDDDLAAAFARVEAARGDTALTYFEFGTLAALLLFQDAGLDLAVLEVGLGGRLDAVNVVDPDVAVITTVDIDHTEWLGEDREAIGAEKAGIARAWKPLVLGEINAPSSVLRRAYVIGAGVIQLGNDFFHSALEQGHWRWREVGFEMDLPPLPLAAPAQRANAATAIAALRALGEEWPVAVYADGVRQARIAARLQRLELEGVEVRVDVGHNPQAARELAAWLQAQPAAGRTLAVFAALADKDAVALVQAVATQVQAWWLAGIDDAGPRSQDAASLAARLQDTAAATAECHRDVAAALAAARAQARPGDRIVVFGSFHTAAQALTALHSGQ